VGSELKLPKAKYAEFGIETTQVTIHPVSFSKDGVLLSNASLGGDEHFIFQGIRGVFHISPLVLCTIVLPELFLHLSYFRCYAALDQLLLVPGSPFRG
jgi:hypothetical protein